MLYDHVTYNSNIYDHTVIGVTYISCFVTCVTITCNITPHPLSKSKIKKSKNKNKNKIKGNTENKKEERKQIKTQLTVHNSDISNISVCSLIVC